MNLRMFSMSRIGKFGLYGFGAIAMLAVGFFLYTKFVLFYTPTPTVLDVPTPFPVGVDPVQKLITEQPNVLQFHDTYLAAASVRPDRRNWLARMGAELTKHQWYQNLASPVSRMLVIFSGERHEQIVDNFGDILRWDEAERARFAAMVASSSPALTEGKFLPGRYTVAKDASPEAVAERLLGEFANQVLVRYPADLEEVVPLKDALIIASLLEREAYDFTDMREISGIIWNRLFIDMPLQLDASLQYVKGSEAWQPWWPKVVPADKFLDSPYNTYQNVGLPPGPIANPSPEAILAALNPLQTDCMFYFHDSNGDFYCTETYTEHVALLQQVYGQGR